MCSSLGRATSSAPSFTQLVVVLCVGLKLLELFLCAAVIFVGVPLAQLTMEWSSWWV